MTEEIGCCGIGSVSRRKIIQAGLSAAALGLITEPGKALAQAIAADGVRPVDIHSHYYPQAYLDLLANEGKQFSVEYRTTDKGFYIDTPGTHFGPMADTFVDLKKRIAAMDEQGVAVHAMSLTAPMVYLGDANFSSKLAKAWNDAASAAHTAYPTRLVALMTLPMLYPDRAMDELERASKLPGMKGVYLGTNVSGHDLDDPMFEPVLARIEKLGLPIFLHPVNTIGGERMKPFYLVNLLGNPFDTTIAACHLIFGGVLDRHPKLEICLPHGGGTLPILIGRVDHGYKVRPELQALHLPKVPSEYLRRFTYDTIVHSKEVMQFVISEVGADRVMLGSDYCFDMGYERPVQFIQELDISTKDRQSILGGTAQRILKLSA